MIHNFTGMGGAIDMAGEGLDRVATALRGAFAALLRRRKARRPPRLGAGQPLTWPLGQLWSARAARCPSAVEWSHRDGKNTDRENQTREYGRHRLLLRHEKEPAHSDGKDGHEKYDPVVRKHVDFREGKIK